MSPETLAQARAPRPTFVLMARLATQPVYYTGRAGDRWVHEELAKAFTYQTILGARRKATGFNAFRDLHGLWFIVMAIVDEVPVPVSDALMQVLEAQQ